MKKIRILRSVRPPLHRAFLAWFWENRRRFKIPVRFTRRTDRQIDFAFTGISKTISGCLTATTLEVMVTHEHEYFECLQTYDIRLTLSVAGGYVSYVDIFRDKKVQEPFPTREALWRSDIFEEFLRWVNEELATTRWIRCLWQGDTGISGASLIHADEDRHLKNGGLCLLAKLIKLYERRVIRPSSYQLDYWIYPIDVDEVAEHFEAILPG